MQSFAAPSTIVDPKYLLRPCDNQLCSICNAPIAVDQAGGCLTVPSKRLKRLSQKTKSGFIFRWNESGTVNYLHISCYKQLREGGKSVLSSCEDRLLSEADESLEQFDPINLVREKVAQVALLINESRYTVCFTGAGISVSAGLPTYRGAEGIDTLAHFSDGQVTETAATAATLTSATEDKPGQDLLASKKRKADVDDDDDDDDDTEYTSLRPTLTHLSLAKLYREGKMNYCITQNCDDLHRKGGFPREYLSELHGNVFVEFCESCREQYTREFCVDRYSTDCLKEPWAVKCRTCGWNHYTGRLCKKGKCKGKLRDTIVNFGDDLFDDILGGIERAKDNCRRADLCICLGSSLTVTPACSLPAYVKKIVIVNLQCTELDEKAAVRCYCTSDCFFALLMESMQL